MALRCAVCGGSLRMFFAFRHILHHDKRTMVSGMVLTKLEGLFVHIKELGGNISFK